MQSAMNTAVSGLKGNDQKISAIAQNVAGANTDGYKRTEIVFTTLVTQQSSGGSYSPGGVSSRTISHIDQRGDLRSTTSPTDMAIDGIGYFVVTPTPGVALNGSSAGVSYLYTRAGSFVADNNGYLRNAAGYYLQGFKTDPAGNPIATNQSVLSSLQPVNVSQVNGISNKTTELTIGMNLPAGDPVVAAPLHIETVAVYDSLGVQHLMDMHWTKVGQTGTTQTWNLELSSPEAAFQNVTKSTGGPYGGTVTGLTAVANGFQTTTINNTLTTGYVKGAFTSAVATGVTFPSTVTVVIGGESFQSNLTPTPTIGGQLTLTSITTPSNKLVLDYNPVSVAGISANPAALQAGLTTLLGGATFGTTPMVVVFDQNGLPVSFDGAATPPSVIIDWSDSITNAANNTIQLNLGTVGAANGIICKAGPYNLTFSSQDGVQFGNFSGVSVNEDGIVSASFDNGQSLKVYKVPVANFANPNALMPLTGDVFSQTDSSGTYLLKFPGAGGMGKVTGYALEGSTVDLATEFSNMIIAQRAFSANTKVITVADEMLANLETIKR